MPREILVVDHDPAWAGAFACEAAALAHLFGEHMLEIHHIGSTSVPGMKAKAIIDILVVIDDITTVTSFYHGMEKLGYRPRGECLDAAIPGTAGRFYFTKNAGLVRTHQVHVCQQGHPEIDDLLTFRDYLRTHPAAGTEYGSLKARLGADHRFDNAGYMRGKNTFVKATLADAHRWRREDLEDSNGH